MRFLPISTGERCRASLLITDQLWRLSGRPLISGFGPSRHRCCERNSVAIGGKADVDGRTALIEHDANGPKANIHIVTVTL
jgi:hypothetical protein